MPKFQSSASLLGELKVIRPKRLYEQVAEQIEALIRKRHLAPGSKLPSERELAEMLGVSRPSLREAMIALETLGLVEVRVGEGTFVIEQSPAEPAPLFAAAANLGPGPLEQFEARRAIEVACAGHAALRATEAQIDELEAMVDELGRLVADHVNPGDVHRSFHELLARASGNLIFVQAVRELWDLRRKPMWEVLRKKVENEESWRAGIMSRRSLVAAVRRRDSEAAAAAMAGHFDRIWQLYFG